jgi:hypothetical protein
MRRLIGWGLGFLVMFGSITAASGGPLPVGGITPDEVTAVVKARGLPVKLGKDRQGDPKIESKIGNTHFHIYFYTCTGGRCAAIQFSKGYDLESGIDLEKLNAWNRDHRFGRAFRDDENDPWVQMDMDLERGSTTESVANNLETWLAVLDAFSQTIGWNGDAEDETT